MALNINSKVRLPSGHEIPLLGYGMWTICWKYLKGKSQFGRQ